MDSQDQQLLIEGFTLKDLDKFEDAIEYGAELNVPCEDEESKMTMYEMVLSKPGYFEFVRTCINAGCDVNYVS